MYFFDSCTSAIASVLRASITTSDPTNAEVLLPAYGSPALLNAVRMSGLRPRFVGGLPERPWMDPNDLEGKLSEQTTAIVLVRFMGLPTNASAIREIIGSRKIAIIEDAAHWFPKAGDIDPSVDAMALSFNRGKPVSGGGGGALLLTDSTSLQERVGVPLSFVRPSWIELLRESIWVTLRNFAISPVPYHWITELFPKLIEGMPYVIKPGIEGMRIDHHRRMVKDAMRYLRLSDATHLKLSRTVSRWQSLGVIDLPSVLGISPSSRLWRYPILLPSRALREACHEALTAEGLGSSRLYDKLLSEPEPEHNDGVGFLHDRDFAGRLLTLPLHSDVSEKHILRMEDIITRTIESRRILRT